MRRLRYVVFATLVLFAGWFIFWGPASFHDTARAAAALVQKTSNTTGGNGGTTLTATYASTPTQGNLLVAVMGADIATAINTPSGWTLAVFASSTAESQAIYYKIAGASEATAVTITTVGSAGLGLHLYEYSGIATTAPLDVASTTSGTGTATNGVSITTTGANDLIFAATTLDAQSSFTSWSNSFTKENDFSNSNGNSGNRATYSGADRIATSTGSFSSVGTAAASAGWVGQIVSFKAKTSFTQAAYRWFANTDSASVGSPLVVQNTSTTRSSIGVPFRLRMLVNVAGTALASSSGVFKLQFADQGTGSCAAPNGSSYADVSTSTGFMRFYDNATPANGIALVATSTDPVDATNTIVNQTYVEGNTFSNTQAAIPVGQDGKWDFALIDNGAPGGATYCFRAIQSDGTTFASYSAYPMVIIGNSPPTVSNVTLNGGNPITLIEGTTTKIIATGTVTDANGSGDILGVTGAAYRTSSGSACTADNNDCYVGTGSNCSIGSCAGNSCSVECDYKIWFYAQPTDSGTPWSGDSWSAMIQGTDNSGATGTATSTGVPLLSLLAFETTSTINYGSFTQGQSMSTLTATSVIVSSGNAAMNVEVYGTNMTSGGFSIPVGQQHFATASLSYASGTTLLANPGSTIAINLAKPTSSPSGSKSTFFWGISIPSGQMATSYTGGNSFIGIEASLPWP